MLVYLVTSILFLLVLRLSFLSGQVPIFSPLDNPASFSSSMLTRVLTYLYLCSFNVWLLLFPSRLCFDWSVGSVLLVESVIDIRLLWTVFVFFLLIGELLDWTEVMYGNIPIFNIMIFCVIKCQRFS